MKFHISKDQLLDSLNIVSKGTSSRSTLPILSGIHIKAEAESVIFTTTDLEISVQHKTTSLVEETGEIVVAAKLFSEIVRSLPDAAIYCSLNESLFSIDCLDSKFVLNTMDPKDYPGFPDISNIEFTEIDADNLPSVVKKVHKAVSKDETRAVLSGILLKIESENLSLIATDSYRLAIANSKISNPQNVEIEIIAPGNIFEEATRLMKSEEKMSIGFTEAQIVFSFGNSKFISRKIEGNYPNYKQIIPSEKSITATFNRQSFIDSVKRAALLSKDHPQIKIEFLSDIQAINISSRANDVGEAKESIEAKIDGESLVIAFNPQYLLDGLSSISSSEVIFEAINHQKAGVLKATGEEDFFYLTMPVKADN
jgi:DNA polymerase-3 subunit beta